MDGVLFPELFPRGVHYVSVRATSDQHCFCARRAKLVCSPAVQLPCYSEPAVSLLDSYYSCSLDKLSWPAITCERSSLGLGGTGLTRSVAIYAGCRRKNQADTGYVAVCCCVFSFYSLLSKLIQWVSLRMVWRVYSAYV